MRAECGWCKKVLEEGEAGEPTSTGMCLDCWYKETKKAEEMFNKKDMTLMSNRMNIDGAGAHVMLRRHEGPPHRHWATSVAVEERYCKWVFRDEVIYPKYDDAERDYHGRVERLSRLSVQAPT